MPPEEFWANGDTIDETPGLGEWPAGDRRRLPRDSFEQFCITQRVDLLMQFPGGAPCEPVPYVVDFTTRALVAHPCEWSQAGVILLPLKSCRRDDLSRLVGTLCRRNFLMVYQSNSWL